MNNDLSEMQRYRKSCETEFWQAVFRAEADYLLQHLAGHHTVLSVGCGPAIMEGVLIGHGFSVTGLDVTQEALGVAPDGVRTVVASAEDMPFPSASFDAVIFVASLQFIEAWQKAVSEASRVARAGGRLIAMLLNPASEFFQERFRNLHSYVRKMRHLDLEAIEAGIAARFDVRAEYFLGVNGTTLFESHDPISAALLVINGVRKESRP